MRLSYRVVIVEVVFEIVALRSFRLEWFLACDLVRWLMATWSGRGQGACPNCSTTYSSRWKPSNCSKCGFELGGSATVSKAQKMCCPPAVNICGGLYSIRTSSRDDRCLVTAKITCGYACTQTARMYEQRTFRAIVMM